MANRTSIRTDLLRLVLAASVPLLVAVGVGIYFDFQQSIAHGKTSLRTLAITMTRNTGDRISDARDMLESLALRPAVRRMDRRDCDPLLKDIHTLNPDWANTVYTDRNGLAICSALAQPGNQPVDAANLPWYQAFRKTGRFSVGQPHYGPISRKWVSVLSVPVRNEREEMIGAVHVSLDLKKLDPNIPDGHLPPDSRYGFFSEDGVMIWRNLDPEGVIGTRPNAEAARRIVEVRDGEFESLAIDGVTRYFSVVPMPDVGWIAFVGVPASHVYASAKQRALWMTLFALATIVATVLLALAIARRISTPIAKLEQSAHDIHEGKPGVRAALDGPREVAAVAEEFNAMLDDQEAHEAQLRAFLDNSFVVAWMKDESGRYVFASDNYLKRLGLSRDAVVGRTDADLVPAAVANELRRSDLDVLERGQTAEVVESTANRDGGVSWWHSCKFVFARKDGSRLLGGLAVDITGRQHALEALRQSEATFRKLFEDSSDAILLIDGKGVFVECNQAALDLLKMTREQFLLLPPSRISPEFQPDGRRSEDAAPEMIALAYSNGRHRFDWVCVNAEGGEFVVEVSLMPVTIKGQTMLHTTWREVTERTRSERNFRNALMFMPIPIGVANSEGAIVFFNEAFTATYGYVVADFAGIEDWYVRAYPDPDYRAQAVETWSADVAEAIRTGQATPRREFRVASRSGEVKRVMITMRPIDDQFVTAFEDITQSKLNEEELAQHRQRLEHLVAERTLELAGKNRELEGALQQLRQAQDSLIQESKLSSLGELVAGIAHELNTPIGNARTVSTTLVDQSEEFVRRIEGASGFRKSEIRGFLHHVSDGARLLEHNLVRASDLIQSFKQVAVDRASTQRRRFNLRKVADEVILTLHPTLKKTPHVVQTEIDPDVFIEGYPGPLGQILVNLIENSLTHGLQGRPEGRIVVSGRQSGQAAVLVVADDGCGISRENLSRVFDPFFTTRLGHGGSGLGLSIVFNIVTGLLGGTIAADSKPGEGARFTVVLPLQAPVQPVATDDI